MVKKISAQRAKKNTALVLLQDLIEINFKDGKDNGVTLLRRIGYQDDQNRHFVLLTNNIEISAEVVALIYKKRWGIELLFKKMKQNFQLHYFYGETENAIRKQVWCTLIAQLLLTVLQQKAKVKKAF